MILSEKMHPAARINLVNFYCSKISSGTYNDGMYRSQLLSQQISHVVKWDIVKDLHFSPHHSWKVIND